MWVVPGLVDMHVHLREPGREDKETIETGTQRPRGWFHRRCLHAQHQSVLDEESKIRYVVQRGQNCPCRIYPVGSLTRGSWERNCRVRRNGARRRKGGERRR